MTPKMSSECKLFDPYKDQNPSPIVCEKHVEYQHKNGFKYYMALKSFNEEKQKHKKHKKHKTKVDLKMFDDDIVDPITQARPSKVKRKKGYYLPTISTSEAHKMTSNTINHNTTLKSNKPMKFSIDRTLKPGAKVNNFDYKSADNLYHLRTSKIKHKIPSHGGRDSTLNLTQDDVDKYHPSLSLLSQKDIQALEQISQRKSKRGSKSKGPNILLY